MVQTKKTTYKRKSPRITFINKPGSQENGVEPALEIPIDKAGVWSTRTWMAGKIFLRTAVLGLLMLCLLMIIDIEPFWEWLHGFDTLITPFNITTQGCTITSARNTNLLPRRNHSGISLWDGSPGLKDKRGFSNCRSKHALSYLSDLHY